MADAFTTIANWDWASRDHADELLQALIERWFAAGNPVDAIPPFCAGGRDTAVTTDDDPLDIDFWSGMQASVEGLLAYYAQHAYASGDFSGLDDVPDWDNDGDWSGFEAEAGCRLWRRATSWDPDGGDDWTDPDDDFYATPGRAQAGDILGPWIIDDLQKAISCLQWTFVNDSIPRPGDDTGYWYPTLGEGADCAAAVADYDWGSSSWGSGGSQLYRARGALISGSTWYVEGARNKSRPLYYTWDAVECAIDIYYAFSAPSSDTFADLDGLGAVEDDGLLLFETLAADQAETRQGSWIGDTNVDPFGLTGLSCPTAGAYGIEAIMRSAVLKWSFSRFA